MGKKKNYVVKWKEVREYNCEAMIEASSKAEAIELARDTSCVDTVEYVDEEFSHTVSADAYVAVEES